MSLLPAGTTAWILTDGKAGLETHCTGLAEALGIEAQRRLIHPRAFWSALMPFGPVDPKETPRRKNSPIAPPFPNILIASGRRTLAYLRRVKRESGGRTFTVYMQDPAIGAGAADVICVPQHDSLRGANVLTSLTSPHGISQKKLATARAAPDARLAHLRGRKLAVILGGNSAHFGFGVADAQKLAELAVRHVKDDGFSLMLTSSRRTPPLVMATIKLALQNAGVGADICYMWDGSGDNPYLAMLALAQTILVTGDSVNMVSEAIATGAPVYVYQPTGKGHPKISRFHAALKAAGVAQPYQGTLAHYDYEPVDCTPDLASQVAIRYATFRFAPVAIKKSEYRSAANPPASD